MAAYAALASLAQLTDLNRIQNKSLFSIDAEQNVKSIHEYVTSLLSFLEDCPQKASRWEEKMRDVAYKTEDIIESLMYLQKGNGLEEQLKCLTEDFGLIAGEVTEDRPVDASSSSSSSSSSSRLAPFGNDAVIGLEDDLIAMKDRLCWQSSDRQVIPIVGMGGIGKTTLARTLYNDPLIVEHFDVRAWLTVSQDYSAHRSVKMLFDSLNLSRYFEIDESENVGLYIHKHLKSRRYLIVLDDVWETRVWDDLSNILPASDGNGSRIMLTTRELDMAAYPDPDSPLHKMRIMDDYQSWKLIKQKVFPNSNCPPNLEDVGKKIAQRCTGLPLAVVLVAGLLSSVNVTPSSWEEIAETVKQVVSQGSKEILSLSYTQLPHHLRPCFLFLGAFPEDRSIVASRLIKLWVAEGFLKHEDGCCKSLEENAEEYLEDLVKRNLVDVTSKKSDGKIKSCSLHDMIRDLCIRIAHEEKFLQTVDRNFLPQGLMKERRISFSQSDIDQNWGQTIRTILCFQTKYVPSNTSLVFLGSFKLLRVLEALSISLSGPHTEIFELYHLRYLALNRYFNDIPSAISKLVNLQTLIISNRYNSRFKYGCCFWLPFEIWEMPQLRHVFLFDDHRMPHPPICLVGVSNLPLENLQTLFPLTDLVWNEKLLQIIPNVKKLGLVYYTDQDYRLHHLECMRQLEKLHIYGHSGFSWRGQNPCFPRTLKKLTLLGGGYPWKDMSVIGSLPNLKVLKLLENACCGDTWETTDEEFPQLIYLLIEESSLLHWLTESSHFPMLKFLVLRSCKGLLKIPEVVGEINTLELIQVDDCSSSILESAKQIEVDQEECGNDTLQVRCNINGRSLRQLTKQQVAEQIGRILPHSIADSNAAKETDETPDVVRDENEGVDCMLQVVKFLANLFRRN